jgi:hypothetical protein
LAGEYVDTRIQGLADGRIVSVLTCDEIDSFAVGDHADFDIIE